jgi:hypothetical protein
VSLISTETFCCLRRAVSLVGREQFKTRSKCFINQYGNFVLPEAGGKPVGTDQLKKRSQCFINQYGNFLLPEEGSRPVGTEQIKTRSQCFNN